MNLSVRLLTTILVAIVSCSAFANDPSLEKPDRGWHWYDLPPEVVNSIKDEIERQVEVKVLEALEERKPAPPAPGSSEWISENLPKFRARAADNPTTENIKAMLFLERILTDRAAMLGRRAVLIAQSDPFLDTSYKPTANMQQARFSRSDAGRAEDSLVAKLVERGLALWVFVSPDCQMCDRQIQALANLTRVNGTPVLFILMNGAQAPEYPFEVNAGLWESLVDNGHSDSFPLLTLPTTYAFDNSSGEYFLLAQGHATTDMLRERVINASDYAGWASPREIEQTRFNNDIVNMALFDFENADGDMTDAENFINHIYKSLMGEKSE